MVLMVENVHIAFFFVVNIASCMQRKGAFDQMLWLMEFAKFIIAIDTVNVILIGSSIVLVVKMAC